MSILPLNFTTANPPYINANNRLQKKPIYYVTFGLVTGPLGTNSQAFPDEYSTGPIKNATKVRKRYMDNPTSAPNQIDPITCKSTFSSMQFALVDFQQDITRIVTNYTMKNRNVSIFAGYADLPESSYVQIFGGQIDNWVKTTDGGAYVFTVVGGLKQLLANILTGHTTLARDFTVGDTIAYVVQTNGFARATDLYDGQGARSYIRIKDTIYSYSSFGSDVLDGTVVWNFLSTGPKGPSTATWTASHAYILNDVVWNNNANYRCVKAGTSATSVGPVGYGVPMFVGIQLVQPNSNGVSSDENHQAGDAVDNFVLYQGNPVTLMLQIMLSTGKGTNYSGTGTNYDVLPKSQGIGLPYNLVNISHMESQRDKYCPHFIYQQYFQDAIQAVKFFEKEFLQQICAWLFENKAGQADMAMFYVAQPPVDAVTLDDTLIVGTPNFDANLQTGKNFLNEIAFQWDYAPGSQTFLNQLVLENTDSQVKYEEVSPLTIDSQFIKTFNDGYKIVSRACNIFALLYGDPPPIIRLRALYSAHLMNAGDLFFLQSKFIPDYITGKLGGSSKLCVVVSTSPDYSAGNVSIMALGIGFTSSKRFAGIAPGPNVIIDYSSATANQKLSYAFVSSNPTSAPSTINGDAPYLISP